MRRASVLDEGLAGAGEDLPACRAPRPLNWAPEGDPRSPSPTLQPWAAPLGIWVQQSACGAPVLLGKSPQEKLPATGLVANDSWPGVGRVSAAGVHGSAHLHAGCPGGAPWLLSCCRAHKAVAFWPLAICGPPVAPGCVIFLVPWWAGHTGLESGGLISRNETGSDRAV